MWGVGGGVPVLLSNTELPLVLDNVHARHKDSQLDLNIGDGARAGYQWRHANKRRSHYFYYFSSDN